MSSYRRLLRPATVHRPLRLALACAALLISALCFFAGGATARAQTPTGAVHVIEITRQIDRVESRFVKRSIERAEEAGASLIVIRIDTPGGSVDATREIVSHIFSATVPVAAYVGPAGAHAASAGTFITVAAPVVAMAPATNIGAAAVVGAAGEDLPQTLGRKATEDVAALMRSIAERRGRPVEPLLATVLEAKAYSAEEAVQTGIADLTATSISELLNRLEGRTVEFSGGATTLRVSASSPVQVSHPSALDQVTGFLANPTVAFLLLAIGGIGLMIEFWSPGLIVPGVIGGILLFLGFVGIAQLPFSWIGVGLFVIALGLFWGELQTPGVSVFGIGAVIALVLSGLFIVGGLGGGDIWGPVIRVSRWLVGGIGAVALLLVLLLAREMRRARLIPAYVSPVAGSSLIGQTGEVVVALAPKGQVRAAGEIWLAELESGGQAPVGAKVRVKQAIGVELIVEEVPGK